jgi:lipid-A-disaccharide synthase
MTPGETIFVSAGEYSGDLLAADLVVALKEVFPKLEPFGITGPAMLRAGVKSIASIDDLGVMGIVEVAKRLAPLRMLETSVLQRIEILEPKFAVLVDFAGFHLRLAEQLRARGVTVFQYVAPKAWAWGGKRSAALQRDFAGVLGVLPFEEDFFRRAGVPYSYVGSPHKDRAEKIRVDRQTLGLPSSKKLIGCLPGSRMDEINLIVPWMHSIASAVVAQGPDVEFVVPVAPSVPFDAVVEKFTVNGESVQELSLGVKVGKFWIVRGMSLEVMAVVDAALVASGTATLECGLIGTPMVVVYAMNDISFMLAQKLVKLPWVSLVNLVAGKEVVHEYIQTIPVQRVAQELLDLVQKSPARDDMVRQLEDIRSSLTGGAALNAASVIASTMASLEPGATASR